MPQSIPIDSIELFFQPEEIQAAKTLLTGANLRFVRQIDKKLWSFTYYDQGEMYECVLSKGPKSVNGKACQCPIERKSTICKHVLASLIWFSEQQQEKTVQVLPTSQIQINIPKLLEDIPSYELHQYILQHLQVGSSDYYLFVLQFAAYDNQTDHFEKYTDILKGLISPHTLQHNAIKQSKIILHHFKRIIQLATQLFRDQNYTECVALCLTSKSAYFSVTPLLQKETLKSFSKILEQLEDLIQLNFKRSRAPEFLDRLAKQYLILVSNSQFIIQENDAILLHIGHTQLLEKQELLQILQQKLEHKPDRTDAQEILFYLCYLFPFETLHNNTINLLQKHPSIFKDILDRFIAEDNFKQAHLLLDTIPNTQKTTQLSNYISEKKLEIAILQQDYISVGQLSKAFLKEHKDIKFFNTYLQAKEQHISTEELDEILHELSDSPQLICEILLTLNHHSRTLEYINENLKQDLVFTFGPKIDKTFEPQIKQMYITFGLDTLESYAGQHVSLFLSKIQQHLQLHFEESFTQHIMQSIYNTQKERITKINQTNILNPQHE